MSQSARSDDTSRSTEKSSLLFRPYFYTTFQSECCEIKTNTSTSTQNKELLPIPKKFKNEAEKLLSPINEWIIEQLSKIATYNSVIPNIFFEKSNDYQTSKYLIDRGMIRTLEEADIINWNIQFKKLYPIRTSGNGNCLLHAVLIAMVAVHDISLHLRDQLAQFMTDNQDLLKSHWRIERLKSDKGYGITTEDSKLDEEWKELCELVHYKNSEDGQAATHLQFLESVHIFSISNMLRRPIIILSEDVIRNKDGEAISVNDLYGIYLPILSTPTECINEPIVLAYDRSHFCPLQTSDTNLERISDGNYLPLYPSKNHILEQTLLPIRYLGEDITTERSNNLIREYLRIKEFDYFMDTSSSPIPLRCAELGSKYISIKDNFFLLYHDYLIDFFKIQKPNAINEERLRERQREDEERMARYSTYSSYSLPPRRHDLSPTRLIDTHLSRQDDRYNSSNYSDDLSLNDGYTPRNNGLSYFQDNTFTPRTASDYERRFQRASDIDHRYIDSSRRQNPLNNLTNVNSKYMNSVEMQIDRDNFKSNSESTQSQRISIPVQIVKPSLSSDDRNLTIYEPGGLIDNYCIGCGKRFYNSKSTTICSTCDHKTRHSSYSSSYNNYSNQSPSRSRLTNTNMLSSDPTYASVVSPRARSAHSRRIKCPHCQCLNAFYNINYDGNFQCSACKSTIFST